MHHGHHFGGVLFYGGFYPVFQGHLVDRAPCTSTEQTDPNLHAVRDFGQLNVSAIILQERADFVKGAVDAV